MDEAKRIKGTKTRRGRTVHVDAEDMAMLQQALPADGRARRLVRGRFGEGAFVFSLEPDCSKPMPPDYVTKRVGVLKYHLAIASRRPGTVLLEDEALRLREEHAGPRPADRTGPAPGGGLSYREIGERLGRSERWAALAVSAAVRRRDTATQGLNLDFDGCILALRKFTSSELLDSGFNISMVAQRQGHGPQVLIKHYAKGRRSADKKAAEHLGQVVHGARQG